MKLKIYIRTKQNSHLFNQYHTRFSKEFSNSYLTWLEKKNYISSMKTMGEKEELKNKIISLLNEDEEFAFEIYRLVVEKYGNQLVTKTYLDKALAKLSKEFYQALQKQSMEFDLKLQKLSEEFDKKLAKQSEEFDKKLQKQSEEFDKKLQKLSEEFDKKLQKQSEEFDKKLQKQSEEFDKKLQKLSEEFDKKLQKLSEDLKKEFYQALAKQSEEFDKKLQKQTEELKNFIDRKFGIIGERWGINAEYTIHNFAKELVAIWGGEVRKWKKKLEIQIGKNTIRKEYEIDIVITDGKEILVEVKSSCDKDDVEKFMEAISIYEEEVGKSVKDKVIVAFFVRDDAKKLAEEYGIKIVNV